MKRHRSEKEFVQGREGRYQRQRVGEKTERRDRRWNRKSFEGGGDERVSDIDRFCGVPKRDGHAQHLHQDADTEQDYRAHADTSKRSNRVSCTDRLIRHHGKSNPFFTLAQHELYNQAQEMRVFFKS